MSTPHLLLYFGDGRPDVLAALPLTDSVNVVAGPATQALAATLGRPLILLAIGPKGGAELARWVDAHGLDGVAGVGLVGVTAPWAERRCERGCTTEACFYAADALLPLAPLEPLRAVAERAHRRELICPACGTGKVGPDTDDGRHFVCARGHAFTPDWLSLGVACAPDDGVCSGCGGSGGIATGPNVPPFQFADCPVCSGTGKALSSKVVGLELLNDGVELYEGIDECEVKRGGATLICYQTREEIVEHGVRAALKALGAQ